MTSRPTFAQIFASLKDKRFLSVLLIGFSSGFPWALHGSVLTLWLQESGFSRSTIGFVTAITAVYAVNWMWSPLIDKIRVPVISRFLDQRRAWIFFTQGLMILALLCMGMNDPDKNLLLLSFCSFCLAVASATQDIAVDSYRIMLFNKDEMDEKIPLASALNTAGWLAGYGFIGGALALWLGGGTFGLDWGQVYWIMALVVAALMTGIWFSPNAVIDAPLAEPLDTPGLGVGYWIRTHVFKPFVEFFQRCGPQLAIAILLFLFSFRMGEAILGKMSLVFYIELGFTTNEVALYQKFLGGFTTIVFSIMGAFVNARFGIIRGMLVGGIAMASSNLMFAWMAVVGPEPWLFMLSLVIDNFTQAFSTVAVVSFISYFVSRTYTGTQFALMTSISNLGRTTLAAGSGVIVDSMGGNWAGFFILTTLMVIPALLMLIWISKLLKIHEDKKAA